MPDNSQPETHHTESKALAPSWHTLAVILLLALLAYIHHGHSPMDVASNHAQTYLASVANGWMLLCVVVAGLYSRREFFLTALKQNAKPWYIEFARALLIFCTYALTAGILAIVLQRTHFAATVDHATVAAVAPQTLRELLLWFFVALTAGFCEEHIFRGYLLRQSITKLARYRISTPVATTASILLSSVIFGSLHLYEGVGGAVLVSVLGIIFATYALYFRNLRAVILAHFLQDFIVGAMLCLRHLRHV